MVYNFKENPIQVTNFAKTNVLTREDRALIKENKKKIASYLQQAREIESRSSLDRIIEGILAVLDGFRGTNELEAYVKAIDDKVENLRKKAADLTPEEELQKQRKYEARQEILREKNLKELEAYKKHKKELADAEAETNIAKDASKNAKAVSKEVKKGARVYKKLEDAEKMRHAGSWNEDTNGIITRKLKDRVRGNESWRQAIANGLGKSIKDVTEDEWDKFADQHVSVMRRENAHNHPLKSLFTGDTRYWNYRTDDEKNTEAAEKKEELKQKNKQRKAREKKLNEIKTNVTARLNKVGTALGNTKAAVGNAIKTKGGAVLSGISTGVKNVAGATVAGFKSGSDWTKQVAGPAIVSGAKATLNATKDLASKTGNAVGTLIKNIKDKRTAKKSQNTQKDDMVNTIEPPDSHVDWQQWQYSDSELDVDVNSINKDLKNYVTKEQALGRAAGGILKTHGKAIAGLSIAAILAYFGKRKFDQLRAEAAEEGMSIIEYLKYKYANILPAIAAGSARTRIDNTAPSNPLLTPYR